MQDIILLLWGKHTREYRNKLVYSNIETVTVPIYIEMIQYIKYIIKGHWKSLIPKYRKSTYYVINKLC